MHRPRHILRDFDTALDSLRADVLMMASLADRNLHNAMACLLERDSELCAITVADEEEIDALEKKIDQDGVGILLRYRPVASDLRHVVSTMKIGSNVERIGDQAVKIAERAETLARGPSLDQLIDLGPMFLETTALFRDSVRAYGDEDVALARSLRARDREIDQLNRDVAEVLTQKMATEPEVITDCLNLIFIARHLERVGDHAKNIGEDAVYAAEAEDIRHAANVFSAV